MLCIVLECLVCYIRVDSNPPVSDLCWSGLKGIGHCVPLPTSVGRTLSYDNITGFDIPFFLVDVGIIIVVALLILIVMLLNVTRRPSCVP